MTPTAADAVEIPKVISLRWANSCGCGADLPVGTKASWDKPTRTMRCVPCHEKHYGITPKASLEPTLAAATANPLPAPTVSQPSISTPERPILRILPVRWKPVTCGCSRELAVGTKGSWETPAKMMRCLPCGERRSFQLATGTGDGPTTPPMPLEPVDVGRPGASLKAEYERRAQKRETSIRARHPWIGGLILAIADEPQSQVAFAKGAAGERKVADMLQGLPSISLLHNRKLAVTRRDGDIDHLAITSVGVFIIDTKHYAGSSISLKSTGGLLGPLREQLLINGREHRALLDGMAKQLEAVGAAASSWEGTVLGAVPIHGILSFVDGNFGGSSGFRIDGVLCTGPNGTKRALSESGSRLQDVARESLHRHLAALLPPA